ncbi:MAG: hypothetical protein Tsb0014_17300 [Pleurocapsa sp.]
MAYSFQLNTNEYLQQCDPKDVISFNSKKWIDIKRLKSIVHQSFANSGVNSISQHISQSSQLNSVGWFYQGQECEILKAGSPGWQKGKLKIKVTLEFIPDEPEVEKSPLDDIRQAEINNNK